MYRRSIQVYKGLYRNKWLSKIISYGINGFWCIYKHYLLWNRVKCSISRTMWVWRLKNETPGIVTIAAFKLHLSCKQNSWFSSHSCVLLEVSKQLLADKTPPPPQKKKKSISGVWILKRRQKFHTSLQCKCLLSKHWRAIPVLGHVILLASVRSHAEGTGRACALLFKQNRDEKTPTF